ncbi:hypothetical protein [Candidatus Uabimicrobium sp. HlEnr_7]|uniref:hypothetical protein n=1 Tax=Candidatus Uabimicrobium helgolandensis TaxID=3095367 RepID=UPI0035573F04
MQKILLMIMIAFTLYGSLAAQNLFQSISLDEAYVQAEKSNKFIIAYFVKKHSNFDKKMLNSTWKNTKIRSWLKQNIAVKIPILKSKNAKIKTSTILIINPMRKIVKKINQPLSAKQLLNIIDHYTSVVSIEAFVPKIFYLGKRIKAKVSVKCEVDISNAKLIMKASKNLTCIAKNNTGKTVGENTFLLGNLKANKMRELTFTFVTKVPEKHSLEFSVVSNKYNAVRRYQTEAKGFPAILLEVIDTTDPIMIGQMTTYVIEITNAGTIKDKNIVVEAVFPKGLLPVSIIPSDPLEKYKKRPQFHKIGSSEGLIKGHKVVFSPVDLEAKRGVRYKIKALAVKTGEHRLKIWMFSDFCKYRVLEEESTFVFASKHNK